VFDLGLEYCISTRQDVFWFGKECVNICMYNEVRDELNSTVLILFHCCFFPFFY